MRTTLDLPEKLIKEVMEITKTKTKSEAIRYALEKVIRHKRALNLIKYRGKIDLDVNLDNTRGRS